MELLRENEKGANRAASMVMLVTVAFFALVLVLDIAGIFTVPIGTMVTAFIIGTVFLLIPTLLVRILKLEGGWVKYVIVLCSIIFTVILAITLSYHVVLLYVYPIAVASLYFSGGLNIFASIITVVGVTVGQIVSYLCNFVTDHNFDNMKNAIMHGALPRAVILLCISAIFVMLCKRTASMLGNLMGAEQQRIMREKSLEVSHKLLATVTELDGISAASAEANRSIADKTDSVMCDSEANSQHIKEATDSMNNISDNLHHLSEMSAQIAKLTQRADLITAENNEKIALAVNSMNEICTGTNESKEIISRLSEQSKKIVEIARVITDISMQTNILALNASVEAAHAGEHGKGFAVVASEIKKLSDQTNSAADDISEIIEQVTANISNTVAAMEKNAALTVEGMNSMEQMKASAELINASNSEISQNISDINQVIETVAQSGAGVSRTLESISGNIENNCGAVQQVAAATRENSAGTETLGVMVKDIKAMAEELETLSK